MNVAVIGLGQMGGPIADNLVRAGHSVRVHDLSDDAMARRVELGAVAAESPAAAARDADVVSIVVFDDAQLLAVCSGADGVLSTLEAGSVIAVHTTATLSTIRTLADLAAATGVRVVDAGISGGETGARDGTLLLLVGGDPDAVAFITPALDAFAKEIVHAGALGTGMALKLARNATGYAWMSVVRDAMDLAVRAGVDPARLRHAIEQTGVFDQALVPLGLGGPEAYPAGAPEIAIFEHVARLADKDLEHAAALADEVGASIPMLELARAEFPRSMRLRD